MSFGSSRMIKYTAAGTLQTLESVDDRQGAEVNLMINFEFILRR